MGYVDSNLLPGETVIQRGKIHWFIFVPGSVFLLIGLILSGGEAAAFGTLLIIGSAVVLLRAVLTFVGTELAVTSKRVIAKTGLISRSTTELNHTKVESFNVDQGLMGRLFGFGTVVVNGTGGVHTTIPNIIDPLEFRRKAMGQIETVEKRPA